MLLEQALKIALRRTLCQMSKPKLVALDLTPGLPWTSHLVTLHHTWPTLELTPGLPYTTPKLPWSSHLGYPRPHHTWPTLHHTWVTLELTPELP